MTDGLGVAVLTFSDRTAAGVHEDRGGPRDVMPEATPAVCEREVPGVGEAMRAASLRSVPTAVPSRRTTGVRGSPLIINLPGRPAAIAECRAAVMPAPTARGGASP